MPSQAAWPLLWVLQRSLGAREPPQGRSQPRKSAAWTGRDLPTPSGAALRVLLRWFPWGSKPGRPLLPQHRDLPRWEREVSATMTSALHLTWHLLALLDSRLLQAAWAFSPVCIRILQPLPVCTVWGPTTGKVCASFLGLQNKAAQSGCLEARQICFLMAPDARIRQGGGRTASRGSWGHTQVVGRIWLLIDIPLSAPSS